MILLRKEAVRLAAFIEMSRLSADKQKLYIESALLEAGLENVSEAKENFYLRDYVEYELKFVQNSYLERLVSVVFNEEITIEGNQPHLYKCPCCRYKTLKARCHYDICPVCFWEDDGSKCDGQYSLPNRLTLKDGKQNFEKFGSSDLRVAEDLDPYRFLKFSL